MSQVNEEDKGGSRTMTSNLDGWSKASSEKGRYIGGSAYSVTDTFLRASNRCCLGYLVRTKVREIYQYTDDENWSQFSGANGTNTGSMERREKRLRTLQNVSLVPLRVPSSEAIHRRQHTVASSRSGWSPLRGRNSHSGKHEHAWEEVNRLLVVSSEERGGVTRAGKGVGKVWAKG